MLEYSVRQSMFAAIRCGSLVAASLLFAVTSAWAEPVRIVVPDRAYADLAETIAGAPISVSVMDPSISRGDGVITFPPGGLVLCSGTQADAWLRETASRAAPPVTVIDVYGTYRTPQQEDSNIPFPWYDLPAVTAFSHTVAKELARREPAAAPRVKANLSRLLNDFNAIKDRVNEVTKDYAHSDVIVADDLSRNVARQLGFKRRGLVNRREQNTPSPTKPMAAVEGAIQRREGSIFLYDKDMPNPAIKELVAAATDNGIPVVALQERLPTGLHYQRWALRQWNAIHGALNEAAP